MAWITIIAGYFIGLVMYLEKFCKPRAKFKYEPQEYYDEYLNSLPSNRFIVTGYTFLFFIVLLSGFILKGTL